MNNIVRESQVPLYKQIASNVKQKITNGHYKIGDRIPSEQELMKKYNVGRVTVRNAINILIEENLIVAKQGLGVFVKSSPIYFSNDIKNFRGFYEEVMSQGIEIDVELISHEFKRPSKQVSLELECSEDSNVHTFNRLFMIKGEKVALLIGHVHPDIELSVEQIERFKADPTKTYNLIKSMEMNIKEIKYSVETTSASVMVAEILNVAPGSPILTICRTTINDQNNPFIYAKMYLCSDLYQFKFRVHSQAFDNPTERLNF